MNLEKLMSIQKNLIPIRKSQVLTVSLLFGVSFFILYFFNVRFLKDSKILSQVQTAKSSI